MSGKQNCIECGKEIYNDYICSRCKRFARYAQGTKRLFEFGIIKKRRNKKMPELDIKPFLDATCVKDNQIFTFKDEGEYKDITVQGKQGEEIKKVFSITIETNKVEYSWTMNNNSQLNFIKKFGKNTSSWVGKQGKFTLVKQNVFGTIKDVIYGSPIEKELK